MRRKFREGVELTASQFEAQPWVYAALLLHNGVLYCKDGPIGSNPKPYGVLYRPTIKALIDNLMLWSGIELQRKAWVAQIWHCEMCAASPMGVKMPDGTVQAA